MKKIGRLLFALLSAAMIFGTSLAGCSSDSSGGNLPVSRPGATVSVTGLTILSGATELDAGATLQLSAVVTPANATNKAVVWASSDESVATVDANGLVKGVSAGSVVISATALGGKKVVKTIALTVKEVEAGKEVVSIELSGEYKTEYSIDEALDLTGLVVTATLTDGSTRVLGSNEYTCSGFTSKNAAEEVVVTVKYSDEITAAFTVSVVLGNVEGSGADASAVYELLTSSTSLSLEKTNIANKAYIVPSDDMAYRPDTDTIAVPAIGVENGIFANLSGTKTITLSVKNVAAFDVCVKGAAGRSFSVKIGDETINEVTKAVNGSDVCIYKFNTGTADTVNIELKSGSQSVYPLYVKVYDAPQVIPVEGIEIIGAPDSAVLLADAPAELSVSVLPARASQIVEWASSNPEVAEIDAATGALVYKAAGTTEITAAAGGIVTGFTLTVQSEAVAVTGVSLDEVSANLSVGKTLTLTASVEPSDATNKNVKWTSSLPAVATVDGNGVVKALAAGTTVITVETVDGSFTATCELTVEKESVKALEYVLKSGDEKSIWDGNPAGEMIAAEGFITTALVDGQGCKPNQTTYLKFYADQAMTLSVIFTSSATSKAAKIETENGTLSGGTGFTINGKTATTTASATQGVTAHINISAGDYTITGPSGQAKIEKVAFSTLNKTVTLYDGSQKIAQETFNKEELFPADKIPEFKGYNVTWRTAAGKVVDLTTDKFEEDTVLTAVKTPIVYTITYAGLMAEDSNPNEVASYTVESETITLADASRTGYTFNGWFEGEEKVSSIEKGSTGNKVLSADFTVNKYTINFDGNGAAGSVSSIENVEFGSTVTLPAADGFTAESGHSFVGWAAESTAESGVPEGSAYKLTTAGNVTLYAIWSSKPLITVTLDLNGGEGAGSVNVPQGSALAKPADPVKAGYVFDGWFLGEAEYDFASSVTEAITLTAKWHKVGGIALTVAPSSDITSEEFTVYENTVTVGAAYTVYAWFVDGKKVSGTSNDLDLSSFGTGKYAVTVIAESDGKLYSASVTVTK